MTARQVAKPVTPRISEAIPALSRNCDDPGSGVQARSTPARQATSALVGRAIRRGHRRRRTGGVPTVSPSFPPIREEVALSENPPADHCLGCGRRLRLGRLQLIRQQYDIKHDF